jgi:hypothetical protein
MNTYTGQRRQKELLLQFLLFLQSKAQQLKQPKRSALVAQLMLRLQ